MSTFEQTRPTMKTRDKLKYGFATVLAIMTFLAIGGLFLARHQRNQVSAQEAMQVQRAISVYGQNGALPEKIELPEAPAVIGRPE